MGLALYRKYRPKSLDDVVGQEHIVTSLKKAIKSNTVSHAYLLTGPRGVGKTSIARILAHELNELPYDETTTHLDIIEIDAASNRRIDEIRDLRDKVHIAPTSAKYKVYIIDEVHMLTREAFNALLKTLEEPPAHAIFILATTEAHKVPDTIISRTQRYTFKPITTADTVKHLSSIAKKEKININKPALELLAEHAGGSFRDSINLLDQLAGSSDEITADTVQQMLGMPKESLTKELLDSLHAKNAKNILDSLDLARSEGVQATGIAKHLLTVLRTLIVDGTIMPTDELMTLLDGLAKVVTSAQPHLQLELALLRYVSTGPATNVTVINSAKIAIDNSNNTDTKTTSDTPKINQQSAETATNDPTPQKQSSKKPTINSNYADDYWQELLLQIKAQRNTLYSVLRIARPSLVDDTLTLAFDFSFHQKQITQAANLKLISDATGAILNKSIQVVCIVSKADSRSIAPQKVMNVGAVSHLTDVSNFFNGAELIG